MTDVEASLGERPLRQEVVAALLADSMSSAETAVTALGDRRVLPVLAATAAAALFRVWPDDPSPADLRVHADRISAQLPAEHTVPPVSVEAVLRASLGDAEALGKVPVDDLIPAFLLVIKTCVHAPELESQVVRDQVAREAMATLDAG